MKLEGLKLFMAVTPFTHRTSAMLDREGPWTDALRSDFRMWSENGPPGAGLWVWEGSADPELDETVGGWDFVGTWRAPTAEEMARLAAGRFPLRDLPLPAIGDLVPFEDAEPAR